MYFARLDSVYKPFSVIIVSISCMATRFSHLTEKILMFELFRRFDFFRFLSFFNEISISLFFTVFKAFLDPSTCASPKIVQQHIVRWRKIMSIKSTNKTVSLYTESIFVFLETLKMYASKVLDEMTQIVSPTLLNCQNI